VVHKSDTQAIDLALIKKDRVLPVAGDVLVAPGQAVSADTVIVKAEELPGDPYVIDLKTVFKSRSLTPQDIQKSVLKRVGDRVQTNEVIARFSRGLFGEVQEVKSPVDGVIEFISRAWGRILIREDARSANPTLVVNAAKDLDIWPATLKAYTRVREGDEVRQGQILAASPGHMQRLDYSYAPAPGFVEKICTRTGTITITRPIRENIVDAYVDGEVSELVYDRGATVQTIGAYIQGVYGIGSETYGELYLGVSDAQQSLAAEDITDDLEGRVIVAGAHLSLDAMKRGLQVGVAGFIAGGADQIDFVSLLGKDLGVGITGQEEIPITIVLTEGFGKMAISQRVFDILSKHNNRRVSINGATQVRAGAIRPEIIIPLRVAPGQEPQSIEEFRRTASIEAGARVRVVAQPYLGLWGDLIEANAGSKKIESEAVVPVARIRLDDGRVVDVPEENLEIY